MDTAAARSAQVRSDLLLLLTAPDLGASPSSPSASAWSTSAPSSLMACASPSAACRFCLLSCEPPPHHSYPRLRCALPGGLLAGLFLFTAASLQQVGIVYTTAGKAGFITGLYVILVPILGLLLRHRSRRSTWTGALVATSGLYLLSVEPPLAIAYGDGLVFVSAFFWAGHVLVIGTLSRQLDWAMLAFLQFLVCSLLSTAVAVGTEHIALQSLVDAAVPVFYGGVLSVGRGLYPSSSGSAASGPRPRGHHPQSGDGFRCVGGLAFAGRGNALARAGRVWADVRGDADLAGGIGAAV